MAAELCAAFAMICALQAPPAPAPQPAPIAKPAGESSDERRARRIAADQAALEAQIRAIDAFGHMEELVATARQLQEGASGTGITINRGSIHEAGLDRFIRWNTPATDATKTAALTFDAANHPLPVIVDFARQLRGHDIDVLVVVFPNKLELYPDLVMDLPNMEGFAGMVPGTARFLLELSKAGVEVLDLTPSFVKERYGPDGEDDILYLRFDNQHWTPRGADLAARGLAQRLAQYPWFTPGTAKEGVDYVVRTVTMDRMKPPPEQIEGFEAQPLKMITVTKPTGGAVPAIRPESPIVLLGDSFVEFHKNRFADFCSLLYRHIGQPVDSISPRGGAQITARDALRRRGDQMKGKRLVVWLLCDQNFVLEKDWRVLPMFE